MSTTKEARKEMMFAKSASILSNIRSRLNRAPHHRGYSFKQSAIKSDNATRKSSSSANFHSDELDWGRYTFFDTGRPIAYPDTDTITNANSANANPRTSTTSTDEQSSSSIRRRQ